MMAKKLHILSVIISLILLTSCSGQDKKPTSTSARETAKPTASESSETPSNIVLNDMYYKFKALDTSMLPQSAIPLSSSPDGQTIYYMERTDNKEKSDSKRPVVKALKGDTFQKVNISKLYTATGEKAVIANAIPFVSCLKWNRQGSMVAFCGGESLTVYDTSKNKLLLADELKNDRVTYFGWSPDGNSIYTEHENLINGTIYNFIDGKVLQCYETDIKLYYKGDYQDGLYFATETLEINQEKQKQSGGTIDENRTIITDSTGKVIKELPCGRFRDSYKDSVLQVGESGFGLYHFQQLEKTSSKEITKEFVYDAKFIAGGNFIYTIKSDDVEKNAFNLCIADSKGKEMAKVLVSGPYVLLSPDGKAGYISGPLKETIDFQKLFGNLDTEIQNHNAEVNNMYSEQNEDEKLLKTIRGAMDTYMKFEISGNKDFSSAEKYFIDSENPPQMAYFDITTMFNERKGYFGDTDFYITDFYLSKLSVKDDRASVVVNGISRNSRGGGSGTTRALELYKKDGIWYVTGFSTFPDSKKAKDLKTKVEKIVKDSNEGKLFEGKFKGADIEIAQIQFWQMSEPTLSSNVDYANYCKVYLKVMESGKEVIYKMVLSKDHSWAPALPKREGLSWL